jgi:hypothetical protein
LFYLNDTLIKDFKFYWKGMTFFTKLHIPSRSSIKREYFVRVIGDTTKKLLDEKSNNLTVNFFLVYKLNGMKANAMAKPVKITYK